MILLLALAVLVALFVWLGRRRDRLRMARGLIGALAAVAAVAAGLKGAWLASGALIVIAAAMGGSGGVRRTTPGMSLEEARSILGVGPTANRAEIEQAYRRLIRRVHPDAGGAPGLAAQLNAARDTLLK